MDEIFDYVTVTIGFNKPQTILYIVGVPQLEKGSFVVYMVNTLVIDNQIILEHPKYILKGNNDEWYVTHKPMNFIEKYPDLMQLEDNCIKPLINNPKC